MSVYVSVCVCGGVGVFECRWVDVCVDVCRGVCG